jgi:type IV pilus assembly protein PilB
MNVDPLGELLVRQNLLTAEQLQTAIGLQRELGGDLRSMVVKLGYVRDADLVQALAQEQHVGTSSEITEDVIDFAFVERLPRDLLERHQVVPLKSDGSSLVLAMTDPNDLAAIEEIQFRAGVQIEPAVATKASIRAALNNLDELAQRHAAKQLEDDDTPVVELAPAPAPAAGEDAHQALRRLPIEKLLRAYIQLQIEKGNLSASELLTRAQDL